MKTLPAPHPEQLRQVRWRSERAAFAQRGNYFLGDPVWRTSLSYPAYEYLRDRTTTFSDLCIFSGTSAINLGVGGRAESAQSMLVSGNYFRALGVQPILGRAMMTADDRPGAPYVAVLSHSFWQRALGGDGGAVGRDVVVNNVPAKIIGVMGPEFRPSNPAWNPDIFLPMAMRPIVSVGRNLLREPVWTFLVFGRLRAHEERARAETEALLRQMISSDPPQSAYDLPNVSFAPAGQRLGGPDMPMSQLFLLMAVAGAVLLIACANIASLLIARADARRREIATRLALGAPRRRVIRQLLTESVLLSLVGAVVGVAVAYLLTNGSPEPDARVWAFVLGLTVMTGVVFGLMPAFHATRMDLITMLKEPASDMTGHRSRFLSGKILVTAQVALSLLLLIGSSLFLRTLIKLNSETLGFAADNLLVFRINPGLNGYRESRLLDFYEQALTEIKGVPGVSSASFSRWGLLNDGMGGAAVCAPGGAPTDVTEHIVAPGFFETMQIPVMLGADFQWRDRADARRFAILSERTAQELFPGRNPVGETLKLDCQNSEAVSEVEILGVAGNARTFTLREPAAAAIYTPYWLSPQLSVTVAVRSAGDPTSLVPEVRRAIESLDPNLPMHNVASQEAWLRIHTRQERLLAQLLTAFAAVALLLASIGIYGTLAYFVVRRTSEIGIRMAIGAEQREVIRMVLRESLLPVSVGIVLGLAGSFALTRFISGMLFGVSATDPLSIVLAVAFSIGTALLAAYVPARRASRIDPMIALRYE